MSVTDIKRAKELSKSLSAFGKRPRVLPTKEKPKTLDFLSRWGVQKQRPVIKRYVKKVPSAFKTPYESLLVKDGKTPINGVDYFTEAEKGEFLRSIRDGIEIPDAPTVEITPELVKQIVRLMQSLPESDRLDVSGIRNYQSFVYKGTKYGVEEMMHGGSSPTSSSTSVYGEVVAGSGTSWTLAHTPTTGTLRLYANGQRLTETVDYSRVGAAVTTITSWAAGTVLADYSY